jgi:hypothetical protein
MWECQWCHTQHRWTWELDDIHAMDIDMVCYHCDGKTNGVLYQIMVKHVQ